MKPKTRYVCKKCEFTDERGELSECPYCKSKDNWKDIGPYKESSEFAKKISESWGRMLK